MHPFAAHIQKAPYCVFRLSTGVASVLPLSIADAMELDGTLELGSFDGDSSFALFLFLASSLLLFLILFWIKSCTFFFGRLCTQQGCSQHGFHLFNCVDYC